ncbi:mitochondrial proton/calcium exchanger protein-like protein isoform X1 [Tanacetum coccineum]
MATANAKTTIQEMAEYSQKWHNETSRGRSTETSDGLVAIQAQLNNLEREIKKVNEKVYAAQVRCEQCKGSHYTKDCPLKEERKTLEEAYYTQFGGPFQEGDIEQQLRAKRHEENSNLINEIQAMTDAAIRNQGASIKTLEIQIGQMSKVLQERGFGSLPSSTETNPRDQVKLISTTVEADSHTILRIGSPQYIVFDGQNSKLVYKSRQMMVHLLSRLDNHYCEKEEEGIYGPKFTEAYGASHINHTIPRNGKDLGRLGELAHTRLAVELADRTVKYPKGIAENRYYCRIGLRERMELDLEARLMGETLVLNRSLDPFLEDYIELNDLNEPFELMRNQEDDLMPTIEEGEVIKEFRNRDEDLHTGIDNYPSYCDNDKKIHIDCAHNLSLENMEAYRDEGMSDVIFGEPFLREVRIKAKRFEGIITLYNGDYEVTYQMVRSHMSFKNYTNEQCNKIPPLLKVSEKDEKNGISHAYQKLKGFYKGVLNLGPDYIRDAKMEEWLTRGHISVHEME